MNSFDISVSGELVTHDGITHAVHYSAPHQVIHDYPDGAVLLPPVALPCRFQLNEKVMAGGSVCEVKGVYFGPGDVTYALVRVEDEYACMMDSTKVSALVVKEDGE